MRWRIRLWLLLFALSPEAPAWAKNPPRNDAGALSIPKRIVAISYNIHVGKGLDRKLNLGRIAALLGRADVVGLNEVDAHAPRTGWKNQAAELSRLTHMHSAFGAASRLFVWAYGNAILSRSPIRSYKTHPLPRIGKNEPRSVLEADLGWLKVFVAHMSLNHGERGKQVHALLSLVKSARGPVVLMGDFNAEPGSPEIARIKRHFIDAGEKAGPTIPSDKPRRRIDYVFVRNLVPVEAAVLNSQASDHRPLMVVLKTPAQQ